MHWPGCTQGPGNLQYQHVRTQSESTELCKKKLKICYSAHKAHFKILWSWEATAMPL